MANVYISSAGTSGPRGTGWLTGVGAPSNTLGFDGDLYLDTTNTSIFYGPKANGLWPSTPTPFTVLKSNTTATTNPLPTNDNTQDYVVGSFWVNTLTNTYFAASNVATGAAVWTPILPVGTAPGTVAAGNDSRIVGAAQVTNNLSDLQSSTTARTNLGLGDSATQNVGITAGTVAAGDDSRITGAAQKAANLSDLQSATSARTNLGLSVVSAAKSNLTALAGPTVTDDSSQGYAAGSVWIDTVINVQYVLTDSAVGAAVWVPILPVGQVSGTVAAGDDSRITGAIQTGSSAGGDLSGSYPNPTVTVTHLAAALPIAQGGTGSTTKNFVDLTTTQNIGGTKTFTGLVDVPTPTTATSAATKAYADSIASGVAAKASTDAATTTALPSNTYNNGASGVGATLTATATGTLTIDGHLTLLNDRILVKNEVASANNGIYLVTTAGAVGVAYVLTRATDMDQPSEITSAFTFVASGTTNASTGWIVTGAGPYTIGTTAIIWTQFSGAGTITVGTGLTQVGNQISLTTPVDAANLPSATTSALGVIQLDGTAADIQPLGSQSAGATGEAADAGHVHPTTGVTLHSEAASSVVSETAYGQTSAVGVTVTYSRSDHTHGTPSLASSAPPTTQAIGTAAGTGVAAVPARADHVHPMSAAGIPAGSAVGDSSVTGVATTFAASDHVHGRESFGAVTTSASYGQVSSDGAASTVSRSDHNHGTPPLASSAPPATEAIGTASATGVASTPARADHAHQMSAAGTPTTSAVGDAALIGNATSFAASNHVHGREGFGAVTVLSAFGTASSNGSATTLARSDHNHGAPALPVASTGTQGIVQLAGDLAGTSTSPVVAKVNGVAVSGTPSVGQVLAANSASTASWQLPPGLFINTGMQSGGVMTFNLSNPNQFDVSAGVGWISDYVSNPSTPTATKVTIAPQTITLSGSPVTDRTTNWWLADVNGNITAQATTPSDTDRRTKLVLGVTGSVISTGVLFNVQTIQVLLNQPLNQLYDLMYALGPFTETGNAVAANGANLSFNKASGTIFDTSFSSGSAPNDPHTVSSPAETPVTFRNSTRVSGSQSALTTTMDVTHYDLNGVLTLIPGGGGTATIQRVFLFGTGVATAQIAVQYGQATYSSLANAKAALGFETFVVNPDFTGIGTLIAWIIVTKQCTSLQDANNAQIVPANSKFTTP